MKLRERLVRRLLHKQPEVAGNIYKWIYHTGFPDSIQPEVIANVAVLAADRRIEHLEGELAKERQINVLLNEKHNSLQAEHQRLRGQVAEMRVKLQGYSG